MLDDLYKFRTINFDGLAKSLERSIFVIPVKTGIQSFQVVAYALVTRLRGHDDFLLDRQLWDPPLYVNRMTGELRGLRG